MLAECLLRPPSRLVLPSKRKGGPLPPNLNPNPPPPAAASTTHGLRSYGERHLGVVPLLGMGIFPSSRFPFPRPLLPRSLGFSLSLSSNESPCAHTTEPSPSSFFRRKTPSSASSSASLSPVVGGGVLKRYPTLLHSVPFMCS